MALRTEGKFTAVCQVGEFGQRRQGRERAAMFHFVGPTQFGAGRRFVLQL
jgi:hypothetical protein